MNGLLDFRAAIEPLTPVAIAVVLVAASIATITDLRSFRVYNWLTIPLFISGLVYGGAVGHWPGLGNSMAGAMLGFSLLFVLYLAGGVGAGDVKLLAGIGAWVGPVVAFQVFLCGTIAGGFLAVIVLIRGDSARGAAWKLLNMLFAVLTRTDVTPTEKVQDVVNQPDRRGRIVPYAVALSMGMAFVFAQGWR